MQKHKKGPPPRGMIGPRAVFLSRLMKKSFNEAVAKQGLFSGQEEILLSIIEDEGITLSQLAAKTNVSAATVSVSVKRMEKNGFVEKKPDKSDARITRLYPTDKARLAPERIKEHMDALEETMSRGMTDEQKGQLSDLLDIAIDNFMRGSEKDA